jgi:glycosyltransferase involved in cell wall biosynthesis
VDDKVSIIIPTRNRRGLLRQAVRSARAQTWPDTELVIVDEASTDGTVEMVAAEFADVRVVKHQVPRGPGGARNSGLDATDSNWVLFFDDDDLLHPRHVESLVLASRSLTDDGSIVSGCWRRFTLVSDEVRLGPVVCAPKSRRGIETLAETLEPNGEGTIWTTSVLWPRRIFAEVLWDEQLFTNGDVDFFGRVILSGKQIVGRQAGMAYYRAHMGDRVAGTSTLRGLLSSARYRLKWSQLLLSHPEHQFCAASMRNGFMALIIGLSGVPEASELMPRLLDAYRLWGGRSYYMSSPPRHPLKRLVAQGALGLGGPRALRWLLKQTSHRSRRRETSLSGYHSPATDADRSDVSAICSVK